MPKVFVSGAAGLVGQNLIPSLKQSADLEIIAADKHPANTRTEGKLSFFRSINCCLRQTGQVRHKAKSRTGDLGAFFQLWSSRGAAMREGKKVWHQFAD